MHNPNSINMEVARMSNILPNLFMLASSSFNLGTYSLALETIPDTLRRPLLIISLLVVLALLYLLETVVSWLLQILQLVVIVLLICCMGAQIIETIS